MASTKVAINGFGDIGCWSPGRPGARRSRPRARRVNDLADTKSNAWLLGLDSSWPLSGQG